MPDVPGLISKSSQAATVRTRALYQGGAWMFNIGVLLLVAAVVLSGGLWFYRRSLDQAKTQWAEQVGNKESDLRPDLLAQLVNLSDSLAATRDLLSNHTFASNAFTFLEGVTHPRVQFTTFNFARDSQKIEVTGLAASYETVTEQIGLLESNPQVAQVDFGGLSLGDKNLVNFKLAIIFKPSLLQVSNR